MSRPLRRLRPLVAITLAAPLSLLLPLAAAAAEAPTDGSGTAESTLVTVRSFAYDPDPVSVPSGGSVRWRWEGEDRHSVTAVDRSFDSDPDCEDNVLLREYCRTGGSEDFVWTAPEVAERTEIAYSCKLHGSSQGMTGTVVVVPPPPSAEPSPAGPSPSPSATASEGSGGSTGEGSGGDGSEDPGPRTGSAPRLGTQTAPGSSGPSVASPEVAAPVDDPELEAFPSPAPIPSAAPQDLGEVAIDLDDGDGGVLRTVLLGIAAVAVTGTAVAFGSLVLFGPRWR